MSNMTTENDMLEEQAAGEYIGGKDEPIPPRTMRQWRYLSKGPAYVKVGAHVRYLVSDLDAFVMANRHEPDAAA